MENLPDHNKQGISKSQTQLTTSETYNAFHKEVVKHIGESIYLLGYSGPPETIYQMADRIAKVFDPFDPKILEDVMEDFMTGTRKFEYQLTIVDISEALQKKGVLTKKDKEAHRLADEFYSFQNPK